MDLELYDCPQCSTQGVLLTAEGACPNCRYPFSEQERRKPSMRIVAASPPGLTSPASDDPYEEAISSWRTVQEKMRRRRWSVGLTLGGMAGLFLSPVVLWGLGMLYGRRFGNEWDISPKNMDKVTMWTAVAFFGGWILFEIGMALSRARLPVQILVRLPIYLFILLMFQVFGLIALFSMFPHQYGTRGLRTQPTEDAGCGCANAATFFEMSQHTYASVSMAATTGVWSLPPPRPRSSGNRNGNGGCCHNWQCSAGRKKC